MVNIMFKLNNKGNVAILLCLLMTAIFGFTAYTIDIGLVYVGKTKLSNAVDAAALAAVLELPSDASKAQSVAAQYLQNNDVTLSEAVITIGNDNKSIQITVVHNIKHFFAPIIGINSSNVTVKAKAIVAPLKSVSEGIRPFAVQAFNFSYGSLVTLKVGAGDGYNGNYNVVALGGTGASVYLSNALYGYNGTLSVGDWIDTEPGNMAGGTNRVVNYIDSENSTFSNYQRDSIRLWTLPLVNTLEVNGRNQILIVGFGEFYVEGLTNKSGDTEISGRFIKYVTKGDYDENLNDTGLYSAKLVN